MLACGDVAVSAQYTEKEVPLRRAGNYVRAGGCGGGAVDERRHLVRLKNYFSKTFGNDIFLCKFASLKTITTK